MALQSRLWRLPWGYFPNIKENYIIFTLAMQGNPVLETPSGRAANLRKKLDIHEIAGRLPAVVELCISSPELRFVIHGHGRASGKTMHERRLFESFGQRIRSHEIETAIQRKDAKNG
jgi:hypothetical protein